MAKEQGKIVKSITNLAEQLAGFTQLLEVVAQEVWQELQPSLARVGSLEELVARVSGDLSSLEKQVEQADATFRAGAVIQLASLVLKSLLLLFTKQQKGVPCPSLSAAFLTIPLLVYLQNCNKKCSAVQCRIGEVG